MASTLNKVAVILAEASDIYFKQKSLDFAEQQFEQRQLNIEIDRALGQESEEKALAIKVIDANMTRSYNDIRSLNTQIDKLGADYQKNTGDIFSLPKENQTTGGPEVQTGMYEGTLDMLNQSMQELNNDVLAKREERQSLLSRLSDIAKMQEYIKGGAGGYEGGVDPSMYDPGDFSYQDYLESTGTVDKPWVEQAYRDPTPKDLLSLNNLIYKQDYLGIRGKSNQDTSSDRYYMGKYTSLYNVISPLTQYKAQSNIVIGYTDDQKTGGERQYYLQDKSKMELFRVDLAGHFDPLGYQSINKTLDNQGLSMDLILQYNSTEDKSKFRFPDGMSDQQKQALIKIAPAVEGNINKMFVEGYNSIEQLKGVSGKMGTGEDLLTLVRKRVKEYNALVEAGMHKQADELAGKFNLVSGVDISKQNEIEMLQNTVEREGFVSVDDFSLTNIIEESKDADTFKESTDMYLLKNLFLSADTDEEKENVKLIYKELIEKWGSQVERQVDMWE
tara:strand:- start:1595 stop:3100 length:1506 start_codon:yes stop_codon:yes gene_type:complete